MPQISGGDLIHRATIEQPPNPDTVDAAGQPITQWSAYLTVWCCIEPLSGRELIAAQAVENGTSHKITMRWRDGISAKMRLNFRGRLFNFLSVMNQEEADDWIVVMAEEGLRRG